MSVRGVKGKRLELSTPKSIEIVHIMLCIYRDDPGIKNKRMVSGYRVTVAA